MDTLQCITSTNVYVPQVLAEYIQYQYIYIQLTNILTLFPAYIQYKCKCQFPNPAPEVAQKPFN